MHHGTDSSPIGLVELLREIRRLTDPFLLLLIPKLLIGLAPLKGLDELVLSRLVHLGRLGIDLRRKYTVLFILNFQVLEKRGSLFGVETTSCTCCGSCPRVHFREVFPCVIEESGLTLGAAESESLANVSLLLIEDDLHLLLKLPLETQILRIIVQPVKHRVVLVLRLTRGRHSNLLQLDETRPTALAHRDRRPVRLDRGIPPVVLLIER